MKLYIFWLSDAFVEAIHESCDVIGLDCPPQALSTNHVMAFTTPDKLDTLTSNICNRINWKRNCLKLSPGTNDIYQKKILLCDHHFY